MQIRSLHRTALVVLSAPCRGRNAAAARIDLLVPAYANPCCGGGPTMWSSLVSSAGDARLDVEFHVIFNPASGPGSAVDGNYVDSSGNGPLPDVRNTAMIFVTGDVMNTPYDRLPAYLDAAVAGLSTHNSYMPPRHCAGGAAALCRGRRGIVPGAPRHCAGGAASAWRVKILQPGP